VLFSEADGIPPACLPASAWFLDNASYEQINISWRRLTQEAQDFKDYCGRNFMLTRETETFLDTMEKSKLDWVP